MAKQKEEREPDQLPGKCFVILQRNWGYNDEYHYSEGGGEPQAAYGSRNEANIICERLGLREAASTPDLFDYFNDDESEYDDCITMEWMAWHDHLLEHGIEPPVSKDDDPPDRATLFEWWNHNYRPWVYSVHDKRWVLDTERGRWDEKQQLEAARYVNVSFYEVVEVNADPDIFPRRS